MIFAFDQMDTVFSMVDSERTYNNMQIKDCLKLYYSLYRFKKYQERYIDIGNKVNDGKYSNKLVEFQLKKYNCFD